MEIMLKTHKKYQGDVIKALRRKRIQSDIKRTRSVQDHHDGGYYVIITHNKLQVSESECKKIRKSLSRISHVQRVNTVQTTPNSFQGMV